MKPIAAVAGVCVCAVVVTGCGGGKGHDTNEGKVIDGAVFTVALNADPGNLDPQASVTSNQVEVSSFAYDPLVNVNATGTILSGLATAWKAHGTRAVLTMGKAITCSDGSAFTVVNAAANINYVANPKSKSPFLGVFLPNGAHATADESARTVTLTTPKSAPFLLNGLADLPMVCAAGMKDRKILARQTNGTGPYQLAQAQPGDQYTYTKRTGYAWGPGSASTATRGLPAKIVAKVVSNETTAANLLLSGGLNAATITGADSQRLTRAHLFSRDQEGVQGEMWFNQAKGRFGADQSVRLALTKALDLPQLQKVLTSERGVPGTALAVNPPVACRGNSVQNTLPTRDLAKAGQLLDQAGWARGPDGVRSKDGKKLALTFVYDTALGSGGSAAAELAVSVWKQLGVLINLKPQDATAVGSTLLSTGDWDIAWETFNLSSPDQLVPILSGPVPPNGNNFAHIDNAGYNAGVAKASATLGAAGCADWLKAEANLVSAADVIPFANQVIKTFGTGARFDQAFTLIPTSIRMQAR